MSMNPEDPRATEREIEALVEFAAKRGHNSQEIAILCALTMGCLIAEYADDGDEARRAFNALVKIAAHHAGIERVH